MCHKNPVKWTRFYYIKPRERLRMCTSWQDILANNNFMGGSSIRTVIFREHQVWGELASYFWRFQWTLFQQKWKMQMGEVLRSSFINLNYKFCRKRLHMIYLQNSFNFELIRKRENIGNDYTISTSFKLPDHLYFGDWHILAYPYGFKDLIRFQTTFKVKEYGNFDLTIWLIHNNNFEILK